jgi:hypothetical protein
METSLCTAGRSLRIRSDLGWVSRVIEETYGGSLPRPTDAAPDLEINIERSRERFPVDGWEPVARGTWTRSNIVVIEDVCTTGFDMLVSIQKGSATVSFRWRPPVRSRAAYIGLRSRWHLLARAVLMQFPSMWWAEVHGASPVHAAVCTAGEATALIGGAAGVGKTTLLMNESARGERATSDNLNVLDGIRAWGVVEPIRVEGAGGRKMPHGRREMAMPNRVESLTPDCVVILRRSAGPSYVRKCSPETTARSLVTGTLMAGELRRYWPYAATLSAGTGLGPAFTQLSTTVTRLTRQLPCLEVALPRAQGTPLAELLDGVVGRSRERWHDPAMSAEVPS